MQEQDFQQLDSLFADLGYELDAPPVAGSHGFAAFGEDTAEIPPGESETISASEEERLIDEMLSALDGEAPETSSSDSGGEYLDLGGGSSTIAATTAPVFESVPPAPEPDPHLDALLDGLTAPAAPTPADPADGMGADFQSLLGGLGEDFRDDDEAPPADLAAEGPDLAGDFGTAEDTSDLEAMFSEMEAGPAASAGDDFGLDTPSGSGDFESLLDGFGDESGAPPSEMQIESAAPPAELGSFLDELQDTEVSDDQASYPGESPFEEMDDRQALPDVGFGDVFGEEPAAPAPARPAAAAPTIDEELELSDDDLIRIHNRILTLTPRLQDEVRRIILEEALPPAALNMLIRLLLAKQSSAEISAWLDEQGVMVPAEDDDFTGVGGPAPPATMRPPGEGIGGNIFPLIRIGALVAGVLLLFAIIYIGLIKPRLTGRNHFERGLAELEKPDADITRVEEHFANGILYLGKDLEWYNRYGLAYRERGHFPQAVKKLEDGLLVKPRDFTTWLNLSETLTMAREWNRAESNLQAMEKAFPGNLDVLERLGDHYLERGDRERYRYRRNQGGEMRIARTHYGKAREYYTEIIQNDWNRLSGHFRLLRAAIRLEDEKLIQLVRAQISHIKADARETIAHTELAEHYQNTNRWNEAEVVLKDVLAHDSSHDWTHYYMGKSYIHFMDYQRAEAHLLQAIRINENKTRNKRRSAIFHTRLGEVYVRLMKNDNSQAAKALQHFQTALREQPDFYRAHINLGHLYYDNFGIGDSGDPAAAESHLEQARISYEQARQHLPKNYYSERFFYNLGWLYYRKGNVKTALDFWRPVYDRNPFHPVLAFVIGNAWLRLQKPDLAIAEYTKVLRYYEGIRRNIPEINPGLIRHRNIFFAYTYTLNNIGVAYAMKQNATQDPAGAQEFERKALLNLWEAREIAEKIGEKTGYPAINLRFVLQREIRDARREMAIAPEESPSTIPRTLDYEKP